MGRGVAMLLARAGAVIETISTMGETHTGFNSSSLQFYGLQFTPTYGGTVTAAQLGGFSGGAQTWTAQVYTNSAGSPGSTVGSASSGVAEAMHPSSMSFTLNATVSAATTYWVVFARSTSTNSPSICAAVTGIVTGGNSAATTISDGSNINASSDVRCSVTITP